VNEKGQWRCTVPAGFLDLSFRVDRFVPQYKWGVRVEAGKILDVGGIELKRGSSLAGWITTEEGTFDASRCRVRLTHATAAGNPDLLTARLQKAGNEGRASKDGFFQIEGVEPGSYVLKVEHPGYATATVTAMEVWPGSETQLKQVVLLRRPLALELAIDPPRDWLDRPWQAEVTREADFSLSLESSPTFSGAATREGIVKVLGQSPGRFLVEIRDSLGNRFYSEKNLRFEGPEDARRSIALRLITVRGTVRLGKEPVAATLWFGGRYGSQRVEMTSNEEGSFQGVLPKEGSWRVEVAAVEPVIDTEASVDVKADRNDVASVELLLPDTLLSGRVLDEANRPVPGSHVTLLGAEARLAVSTGDGGLFELRAVPEGRLVLSARASAAEGSLTSDEVMVEVAQGIPVGPVDLVLRRMESITGRVESLRGPVAGAAVSLAPRLPPMGLSQTTYSEMDGRFSSRVPAGTQTALAIVSAPGRALKAFEIPVSSDTTVLFVPEEGGELKVVLPFSPEDPQGHSFAPIVMQNGLPLPLRDLSRWAAGHGSKPSEENVLHIPRLAAGEYRVCLISVAVGEPATESKCAEGSLSEGGTLVLNLASSR
jgi:hypothetical protein